MKKKILLSLSAAILVSATFIAKHLIFTVPAAPQFIEIAEESKKAALDFQSHCAEFTTDVPLDRKGELRVSVWNMYKQQNQGWQQELTALTQQADLVLLQEASLTTELQQFIIDKGYSAELVRAFDVFETSAGVLNLALQSAKKVCAHTAIEPWLRLPKSALLSEYPLSTKGTLMVVNIHAINFTIGTEDYQNQIATLSAKVTEHKGPLIIAGDFNTWSEARVTALLAQMNALGMKEVVFTPDERMRFVTGLALDHIYYRGLEIKEAHSEKSNASDHNPLQAVFSLKTQ